MAWRPFRNIGLKLAALGLGTLLWLTVSGHEIERRIYVPVSYSGVPPLLELTGDQMDGVAVYVRGDDNLVGALREGDIRVVVSLADAQPGLNVLPLRIEEVVAPLGVQVLQIDPGTANVTLERSGRVSVPVRPTVSGRPPEGFTVSDITVQPATVVIAGPESRLRGPISVITDSVGLDNRSASFTQDVGVGVADAQLRVVEPRTVRVTVRIVVAPAGEVPTP
jgi:YbbR domain-containing protein